jgi:hypothetical protein
MSSQKRLQSKSMKSSDDISPICLKSWCCAHEEHLPVWNDSDESKQIIWFVLVEQWQFHWHSLSTQHL